MITTSNEEPQDENKQNGSTTEVLGLDQEVPSTTKRKKRVRRSQSRKMTVQSLVPALLLLFRFQIVQPP